METLLNGEFHEFLNALIHMYTDVKREILFVNDMVQSDIKAMDLMISILQEYNSLSKAEFIYQLSNFSTCLRYFKKDAMLQRSQKLENLISFAESFENNCIFKYAQPVRPRRATKSASSAFWISPRLTARAAIIL